MIGIAYLKQVDSAAYSASVDESAIIDCNLLHYTISIPKKQMTHLVIEKRFYMFSGVNLLNAFAKSESA